MQTGIPEKWDPGPITMKARTLKEPRPYEDLARGPYDSMRTNIGH